MIEAFVALGIVGWFLLLAFFMWEDVRELCGRLAADDVDADGAFTPPLGLTATTTTVGVDTFPREWVLERTGVYDQEDET